jgi:hypothetical protein
MRDESIHLGQKSSNDSAHDHNDDSSSNDESTWKSCVSVVKKAENDRTKGECNSEEDDEEIESIAPTASANVRKVNLGIKF